jgi:hypothetical protein
VAPLYATSQRPAYVAPGGYTGTEFLASVSRRHGNFWFGAYTRYDVLDGAVFIDSPLIKSRHYWSGGVGAAWVIAASHRLVEAKD